MDRIADALVLVFTESVSLTDWERTGLLERELALYRRLETRFGRIVFVTWGDDRDSGLAQRVWPGLTILCASADEPLESRNAALAAALMGGIPERGTVIIKTNQHAAGEQALALRDALASAGRCAALIARGGYPWSRFAAWEFGAESGEAAAIGAREGALCRGADTVVGTTPGMIDDLRWRHALPAERTMVVPNYISGGATPNPCAGREPGLILTAGRLVAQKRIDRLIGASAVLTAGGVEHRLLIVGEGPLEGALRERASSLSAPVEFRARVPHAELLDLMRSCAVYAQASDYEGHPKTVLEAMACATPVVVTRAPGLSDVVTDGRSGLIADGEPERIAERLSVLLRDAALARRLGTEAASAVAAACSLERIVEMEVGAYESALRSAGARVKPAPPPVRWEQALLSAPIPGAVGEWVRSVRGFARRLDARQRAEFLMALDSALYTLQGEAAIEASGGLHPKHRLMRYHDFFTARTGLGERVLDLGCGPGAVACSIAERSGATVVGVDLSERSIRAAKDRAREAGVSEHTRFVVGDICDKRIPGAFDVVVLSNVLEHIADRPAMLRRWAEWYRPRRFLIRVPAFDRDWRTPWKRELGVEWRLDDTHETEYTGEALTAELSLAGLSLTERVVNWGEYWVVAVPELSVSAPGEAAA